MGKTYWYVDLENVGHRLDTLVDSVKRYDRVVFAYSVSAPCISASHLEKLEKKRVKVLYLQCQVGAPNAMDFQIVMRMVADYTSGDAESVRVYSNDKGYILPMKAWADNGHNFGVVKAELPPVITKPDEKPVSKPAQNIVHHTLLDDVRAAVGKNHADIVYAALRKSRGDNVKFHCQLQRTYHQRAAEIYWKVVHLISRWREV